MTGVFKIAEDLFFERLIGEAERVFGDPIKKTRRHKLLNLSQFFIQTLSLPGRVAECGVWRGLSAYFLCRAAEETAGVFDGGVLDLFDSFEGLPPRRKEDGLDDRDAAGKFRASLAEVRGFLNRFPRIRYHAGWFHRTLPQVEPASYRFVHVDADLYQSTREALEYFYPRLEPFGILVCDDYGDVKWPGVKKAVEEYSACHRLSPLFLSSCQVVFLKAYENAALERETGR